jgi:hypothetical protein
MHANVSIWIVPRNQKVLLSLLQVIVQNPYPFVPVLDDDIPGAGPWMSMGTYFN